MEHPKLDWSEFHDWLRFHLLDWNRKEFKDFDYINITLPLWQILSIIFLSIAENAFAIYLAIKWHMTFVSTSNFTLMIGESSLYNADRPWNEGFPASAAPDRSNCFAWAFGCGQHGQAFSCGILQNVLTLYCVKVKNSWLDAVIPQGGKAVISRRRLRKSWLRFFEY